MRLTRNTQINHVQLAQHLSPYDPNFGQLSTIFAGLKASYGEGAAWTQMNAIVGQQAAMIGYVDDFKAMTWVTVAAIPLIFLLRRPGAPAATPVPSE